MADGYSSDRRGQIEGAAPSFDPGPLVAAAIVVAALYFGFDVLVPFVIAVLLSFVLAIPARKLQDLGLGRVAPVAIVVILTFTVLAALAAVLVLQLAQLAADLPIYETTIRAKMSALREAATGSGPLERAASMFQDLMKELGGGAQRSGAPRPETAPESRPIPVEIAGTRLNPLQTVAGYVTPLLHPLAMAALVAVFVVFILLQRGDLRNRVIRLAGSHDLQRTTAAMNDAAARLSRFFLTQVFLNGSFGLVVGLGLWAIGVPSPVLWGIMAALSRFIPYIGVILAAGGPLILSAAVDPQWTMLLWTGAFFILVEFLVGQVIEPLVYGHSTGLSPVAVIASVTFWTLLWGPVGLILATPLTVCLVVMGRHVERLEFLDVMLGDRPPLTVAESFYQRMLAGDAGEAFEQAELFLKDRSLATYYDEVAVKGLALAQLDLSRGALDAPRLARVEETVSELIDDLSDHGHEAPADAPKSEQKRAAGDENLDETLDGSDRMALELPTLDPERLAPEWRGEAAVLCIGGRNSLDRTGAAMLAQLLGKHGLGTRVEGPEVLSSTGVLHLPSAATRMVCLAFLDTSSPVHVRYGVRRIRRRLPQARIIVGSWGATPESAKALCEAARSDSCASRLIEAAAMCLSAAATASPEAVMSRHATPASDAAPPERGVAASAPVPQASAA